MSESQISNLKSQIICGDCLAILPTLPPAAMIFADPPDNIGCRYDGFEDRWATNETYIEWLSDLLFTVFAQTEAKIFWLSFNARWVIDFYQSIPAAHSIQEKQFIWRYTFGQHNNSDCGSGYRPLLRFMRDGAVIYPDAIREPSLRQTRYSDKRANAAGRVPDDVWEFPRVCGTFKERKPWHPCQHPKDLLRRIVLFSTRPGDLVIDLFAGSGNMIEVCKELGRECIGIEISETYCKKIAETTSAELVLATEHTETTEKG